MDIEHVIPREKQEQKDSDKYYGFAIKGKCHPLGRQHSHQGDIDIGIHDHGNQLRTAQIEAGRDANGDENDQKGNISGHIGGNDFRHRQCLEKIHRKNLRLCSKCTTEQQETQSDRDKIKTGSA